MKRRKSEFYTWGEEKIKGCEIREVYEEHGILAPRDAALLRMLDDPEFPKDETDFWEMVRYLRLKGEKRFMVCAFFEAYEQFKNFQDFIVARKSEDAIND